MRFLLYALIAASPFFLASNRLPLQWFWVMWTAILAIPLIMRSGKKGVSITEKPILFPIVMASLFIFWGCIQAFVPTGSYMSYGTDSVDSILSESGVVSAIPSATMTNVAYFWSHLVVFIAAYAFCDRRFYGTHLIRFCAVVGAGYALYGFIAFAAGNEYVLWFEKSPSDFSLTSTFISRNSYAAYAGLSLQCLIAYAFFWTQKEIAEGRTGRERARQVLEALITRAWWLPLAIFIVATALILTNSRAGFGSVAIAVLTLILLSPNNFTAERQTKLKRVLPAIGLVILASVVFTISGEVLEARLQNTELDVLRSQAYETIALIIQDYPLTGTGLGTFQDVFLSYQPFAFTGFFDRAHSDHLEIIMTAGIPAALLIYAAFTYIAFQLFRALKFGLEYRSFIALGLGVLVQLGLHSFVDFSLQMPANSYLFVVILGASLAIAKRSEQAYRPVVQE